MTAVALGEVAVINPRTASKPLADETVAFVPMAALNADRASTNGGEPRPFAEVAKGYTLFADGDLLIAKITPCFENNKIGQARLAYPVGVGSSEFHVVRPDRKRVHDRFLLHYLRQDWIRREGELRMTGSGGQRRVPAAFLADLRLPLPDLAEQRRIAAVLDQADALRIKLLKAAAILDELAQSIFLNMFATQKSRERVALKALTTLITKGTTPTSVGLSFSDAGVPFLRVQNLLGGTVQFGRGDLHIDQGAHVALRRSRILPGDVLVSIAGTIGRCAVVPAGVDEMNCNQAVAIVRLTDPARGAWLRAWLSTPDAIAQMGRSSVTATISNLSLGLLGSLRVPVVKPSEIAEFNRRVERFEALRTSHETRCQGLDELADSLAQRAFGGGL